MTVPFQTWAVSCPAPTQERKEPTDAQLVQRYQQIDAYVTKREAALEAELKEHKAALATIKNEFLRRFNERGSSNSKTEFGTPYRSTILNVKVVDRDKFMQFCLSNWGQYGSEMLNVSAVKDPVKQFLESQPDGDRKPPPGIETSEVYRINMPKG